MKTELKINLRAYPVVIKDARTGEVSEDTIVLEKERLQAAQLLSMCDKDIIYHIYNRKGYRVLEIGQPDRRELALDLDKIYYNLRLEECTEREIVDMTGERQEESRDAE